MNLRVPALVMVTLVAGACQTEPVVPAPGTSSTEATSDSVTAPAPPAPTSSATATPSAAASGSTAHPKYMVREQNAADTLEALNSQHVGPRQAGLIAASGLDEDVHDLPKGARMTLNAIASKRVDYSQRLTIINAMLSEEPGSSSLTRVCGQPASRVTEAIVATTADKRLSKLAEVCPLKVPDSHRGIAKKDLEPFAILFAAVIADLLHQRGDATPSELEAAKQLILVNNAP